MSDFLKKFKSVFIVEDAEAPAEKKNESSASTSPSTPITPTNTPAAATTGAISNKFVDILAAALEKNNPEGFDYFEFRQALANLAKMSMDEPTRYQSAYAMAQTMGVTAPKLIESAQFYLSVLNSELNKFSEAHAQQRSKLIGGREDAIKGLEAQIEQKNAQIQALSQEIQQHQQDISKIKSEIEESTVKIESTRADFDATFASVYAQIDGDLKKMQNYLK
ncbi:MAG: hypothetical protein KGS48_17900 [Bacteroidetes bacterium]|nr:hypothetical protein [Bacteroidota bacterium]